MKLEEALKLQPGTKVRATMSWEAPGQFTQGREYVLQRVVPLFGEIVDGFSRIAFIPSHPNDTPCNCRFYLEDNSGYLAEPLYHHFEVISE